MVVDDLDDLRLIEARDGLRRLIVVDQHDALAARLDEVIPRERADNLVVFVQNRVAAVAAFEYDLAHVVDKIGQVERLEILRAAHARDLDGVIDHAGRLVGVEGRGDDAGVRLHLPQLLRQLGLTHDQAADLLLDGAARHLRLLADDDDGVRTLEQQIFIVLRQRNGYLAADRVGQIPGLVQDLAVQNAQQIEDRDLIDAGIGKRAHVIARDFAGREHAVQLAVFVRHGNGGNRFCLVCLQSRPGPADRDCAGQGRRRVVVQIAHLRAHGLDAHRRLKAEAVEHKPRLVGDMPETRGNEFPVTQGVSKRGVGHGGNDGIGIGVAVAGDIDGFHEKPPYARGSSIP